MTDIEGFHAAAYLAGIDRFDWACQCVSAELQTRDDVIAVRDVNPAAYPGYGSADADVIARRIVADLMDAGWSPPSEDAITAWAPRLADARERFDLIKGNDPAKWCQHPEIGTFSFCVRETGHSGPHLGPNGKPIPDDETEASA